MTIASTPLPVEPECKYSQLHMRAKHEHERTEDKMSRPQPTHRRVGVTLDSVAHWWVPARTPTVHQCPQGKAVGGPTHAPRDDHRQHDKDKSLRLMCFQETGVDTHLESYVVAEPAPQTGDLRRDVVKRREQTRRQQCRSGEVPDHQEDRAEKRNQSSRRRSTRRPSTSRFPRVH